jgi:hypothetical protein
MFFSFKPVDLMSFFGINTSSIHLLVVAVSTPKYIAAARADDFASPSVVTAAPHGVAVREEHESRRGQFVKNSSPAMTRSTYTYQQHKKSPAHEQKSIPRPTCCYRQ